jgi:NarL family two-component system sensor histidine kinase LiaS
VVQDRSGDELGQLTRRLNVMAEQLQNLVETRQELAMLEERNRLARDLHDSVKQQVFATAMQLAAARSLLERDPEAARQSLAEAERLTRQSQQELTGLIQELRPAALEGRGLAEALREFVPQWAQRTGIEATVRVQGERALPLTVEQALFRVAQEALANVARHSQAETVDVHLAWAEDVVSLIVSDDGRGFDRAARTSGVGLRSMAERMERLGGTLQVESERGAGTRVVAWVKIGEPGLGVGDQGAGALP